MGEWIDLTRPLDTGFEPYRNGDYADPPLAVELWSDIARDGFEVWRLAMGTQTGTHIDAPSHFAPGGATLETLGAAECVGSYRRIAAEELGDPAFRPRWGGERHLLLDARTPVRAAPEAIETLLTAPARIIVMVGSVEIAHPDPFLFHRRLAETGKFLVEDTLTDVGTLPGRGEIIVLPLRLAGVSGSPVRLLLRGVA